MKSVLVIAIWLAFTGLALGQEPVVAAAAEPVSFIQSVMWYIDMFAQAASGLMVFGTLVTRLIPVKKDDAKVAGFAASMQKIFAYLPTFGINPRTKKLEEALKEAQSR